VSQRLAGFIVCPLRTWDRIRLFIFFLLRSSEVVYLSVRWRKGDFSLFFCFIIRTWKPGSPYVVRTASLLSQVFGSGGFVRVVVDNTKWYFLSLRMALMAGARDRGLGWMT
jgi:Na+-transporting NADH:ubiquinone oxidoreductase subunit NqrB